MEENKKPPNGARKTISIMVPTYNEEENVVPLADAIAAELSSSLPDYDYEILFIDNCSTDRTRELLRMLCARDRRIKAIFNARNFGQFHSPYWGLCQTSGDCAVSLCADFQDPVELIPRLVREWERGHRVVCAVKADSRENRFMRFLRSCYYALIGRLSQVRLIEHFTGFGLYDRSFIEVLRHLEDPSPFLRGVVAELGFSMTEVAYEQPRRRAGRTHNSFFTLYDAAMQSFAGYTKAPLRAAGLLGAISLLAFAIWGALLLISGITGLVWLFPTLFLLSGLQLVFLSLVGEYLFLLRSKVVKRPLVLEEERINFGEP